jgi:PEP-CTERM motif
VRKFFVASLLSFSSLCFSSLASAGVVTYDVTVDTSSINGTMGSLDFNFNPGPLVSQLAQLQILNFTSDGMLAGACPCGMGDVTGQLPSTLTFDNGTGFNDYFEDFTYGSGISFAVSLYGPALSSPDGVSTSGSTFAFSMFSDAAGTIPVLTSDTVDGFAFTVDVNLDGSTTVTNYSAQTSVAQAGGSPGGPPSGSAPEPGTLGLMAIAMAAIGAGLRRSGRWLPWRFCSPGGRIGGSGWSVRRIAE